MLLTAASNFKKISTSRGLQVPLALSPCGNYLYAGLRSSREIASFRIDEETKHLSHLRTIALDADTCYIATDKTGNFLLSAYYGAGKVTVHAIGDDKTVQGDPLQTVKTDIHAHCVETDASNRYRLSYRTLSLEMLSINFILMKIQVCLHRIL